MEDNLQQRKLFTPVSILVLSLVGLALNIIPARLATQFGIPLYLDSIGTILATMIGGFLPGVIAGFLSNVINGLSDPITLYYAVISVLLATATLFLHRKGMFENPLGIAGCIMCFALVGGALGSALTWNLYGFSFGEGVSAPYVHLLYDTGLFPSFLAQLLGDFLVDLIDKGIVVFACVILYKLTPQRVHDLFSHLNLLKTSGLADAKGKSLKNSLLRRVVAFLLAMEALILGLTSFTCFHLFRDKIIESNIEIATGAANFAAQAVSASSVDSYIALGHKAPGYFETEEQLANILSSSSDLTYLYVYRCEPDGVHVVFDIDSMDENGNVITEGNEPGDVIDYDVSFDPYRDELLAGEEIDPIITNDTYGWLLTVYVPIRNSNGVTQAYACADISVEDMLADIAAFLAKILSLLVAISIVVLYFAIYFAEKYLIIPINTMQREASDFAFGSEEEIEESLSSLCSLNINTGDEISELYEAIRKLAVDSKDYTEKIQEHAETITSMQEGIIMDFASMVEARDKCTGDHIQKTSFYVDFIANEMMRRGIYPDQLTPETAENMVRSAPLHDVGKIKISDVLLNKPGRLTDEEFEIMKTHTTEGMKILSETLTSTSDAGYLHDSIDMAWCHHEWWNGRGYPRGLSGEEIPLAARIMAVADVFDALVSRRSYKRPFTFDKAVQIIREESGTHFDPLVANTFLDAVEQLRPMVEESQAADDARIAAEEAEAAKKLRED